MGGGGGVKPGQYSNGLPLPPQSVGCRDSQLGLEEHTEYHLGSAGRGYHLGPARTGTGHHHLGLTHTGTEFHLGSARTGTRISSLRINSDWNRISSGTC